MSSSNQRGYFPQPLNSPSQTSFLSYHANEQRSPSNNSHSPSPNSAHSASQLSPSPRGSVASNGSGISSNTHASSSAAPTYQNQMMRGSPSIQSVRRNGSFVTTPFGTKRRSRGASSVAASISDKFSLSADPAGWGTAVTPAQAEPDDIIHNYDRRREKIDARGNVFTARGLMNLGCLLLLGVCLVGLFAGYPIASYFTSHPMSTLGGFNLGGINASGQVPKMAGNWGRIDVDTPQEALYIQSFNDGGKQYELVFSDEFNVDGRSFYPGDDPYWEAVDLHYWQTGNLEWYDPEAITTSGGALRITLAPKDPINNHNLSYTGGMLSTWNKFCFTGGLFMASVTLPGSNNKHGLWPAIWAMGNLGRAGYGASLEGMWPYTYDACDVGTAPNQTVNGLPTSTLTNGDPYNDGLLSFMPGQRLSRCTCPGESHPGPVHGDGTYVGRSAPEIDMFEAQISDGKGFVSQSAQWGPFNYGYLWYNTSDNMVIPDPDITSMNNYIGGVFQQATSCVTKTNQNCYQLESGCFATYGFEYKPGFDGAYISWINNDKLAWTLNAGGMAADTRVEISARPISQEPMYLLMNLGMSQAFGAFDPDDLTFPSIMSIDWVRIYQPKDAINIGCDPPDFPTAAYINEYIDAYTNPNFTTWQNAPNQNPYGQPFPKNKFVLGGC